MAKTTDKRGSVEDKGAGSTSAKAADASPAAKADKPAAGKVTTKKAAAKKAVVKKTVAKKTVAKKATTKKASVSKSAAPTAAAKKTPAKKAAPPTITAGERRGMIAEAAYLRAEAQGFNGDTYQDWVAAEAQIDAYLAETGTVVVDE